MIYGGRPDVESKEWETASLVIVVDDVENLHRALLDALPPELPAQEKSRSYFDVGGIHEFLSRYRRGGSPLLGVLKHELPHLRLEARADVMLAMVRHARTERYKKGWFLSAQQIRRISRAADVAFGGEHHLDAVRANGLDVAATGMWLRHAAVVSTALGYCIDGARSAFIQTGAELEMSKASVNKVVDLVEDRLGLELFCKSPGGRRQSVATSEGARLYPALAEICRGVAQLTAVLADLRSIEDDAAPQ